MKLLVLLGLTGVGKSTAVAALEDAGVAFTLLPNRRTLTDDHIIPEMQRAAGSPVEPVTDRVRRFALTRRYRELHPGGMAHALRLYLGANPPTDDALLVFDNLRGLDEARAAVETFPAARFILLDAPPLVRLQRLVGRQDRFDVVGPVAGERAPLEASLGALGDLRGLFEPEDVLRLAREGIPKADLLKAVRIIVSEAESYDMAAAAAYLCGVKGARDFLHLDTAALPIAEVRAQIGAWL